MSGRFFRGRLFGALVALVILSACVATYQNHGYAPSDADLAVLKVGVDTRDSVATTIGRPAASGVLKDSAWYYVSSRVRFYGPRRPRIIDRQIVELSFDHGGRLSNIERFTLKDGRVVALSRRVTENNVKGISFLRQLLKNVGRVDLGQALSGK